MFYEVCCLSNNKDYVAHLRSFLTSCIVTFTMNYTTAKLVLSCLFHYKNTSHFTSLHSTTSFFFFFFEVEVEVIVRPTVSRPVCLGVMIPSGSHALILVFCLTIAGFLL
jgi:hypothetical protein